MLTTTPALFRRQGGSSARPGFWSGVKRFAGFLWWLLTGFGLLAYLLRRRGRTSRTDELVIYTVHRAFFLWAIILAGFVGSALVARRPDAANAWGWVYVAVLLYTLVTLLFDVGTWRLVLWAGAFAFVWLISIYHADYTPIDSFYQRSGSGYSGRAGVVGAGALVLPTPAERLRRRPMSDPTDGAVPPQPRLPRGVASR